MSFLNQKSAASMVGIVLLVIATSYGVRIAMAGGFAEFLDPSERLETQLENALSENPGYLAAMQAMETEYPEDYDDFLEAMTRTVQTGGDEAAMVTAGNRAIGQFLNDRRRDFVDAPSASLAAARKAERALLVGLQAESPVACGDYIFGTIQPADPLSPKANKLLGDAVAAKVRAMGAGRRDRQMRFGVTPMDVDALAKAMQDGGASKAQVDALLREGDIAQLTDEQQCDAAARMMAALDTLPVDSADLLTGALLAPR
jgi:hypothetical protein